MLPRCRRTFRLEPAQPRATLDARRALADRLGYGNRDLSDELRPRFRDGASPARRHRRRDERIERYGAGHLDIDDAGSGRDARPADRAGEFYSWRHKAAAGAVHGGSMTMASVGSAVQAACRKAREDALARGGDKDVI